MAQQPQTKTKNGNGGASAPPPAETKKPGPRQLLQHTIEQRTAMFEQMLPPEVPVQRFIQTVMTAVTKDTKGDLVEANRASLISACMDAARDGLLPDGKEGALIVYNEKIKIDGRERYAKLVHWMPMVGGIIKAVRSDGGVTFITSKIVRQNDEFDCWTDDQGDHLHHKPVGWTIKERGPIVGVFAHAFVKDSPSMYVERMSAEQVADVRKASKAPNSPAWTNWWDEMARKAVIKRLCKALPLTERAKAIIDRDNERYFDLNKALPAGAAGPALTDNRPKGEARLDAFAKRQQAQDIDEVDDAPQGDGVDPGSGPGQAEPEGDGTVDADYEETSQDAGQDEAAEGGSMFSAVDEQGQPYDMLTPGAYADVVCRAMEAAGDHDTLNKVWQGSRAGDALNRLAEINRRDLVERLNLTYDGRAKKLSEPRGRNASSGRTRANGR